MCSSDYSATVPDCNTRVDKRLFVCGHAIIVLAFGIACLIGLIDGSSIEIRLPLVLLGGSLFLWPATSGTGTYIGQTIVGLYMFCIVLNMIAGVAIQIPIFGKIASISVTAPLLGICGLGYMMHRVATARQSGSVTPYCIHDCLTHGLLICLWVVGVHCIFLAPLLDWYYGNGYGDAFKTLGWVSLFLLACQVVWPTLALPLFRRCCCVIFCVFFVLKCLGL